MKIGLCGTMSVGKTTLVKALAELPEFEKYHIATERSKYLRDLGVPLNTDSTINGQLLFIAERSGELLHKDLITDRTVWDVSAFTMLAKSVDSAYKSTLVNTAMLLRDQYDVVFYVSPEGVEMEDNGVRETDLKYRETIDSIIKLILYRSNHKIKHFTELSGTTEERIAKMTETIFG